MTSINARPVVVAIVAAAFMAIPASATANALPETFRTDAAQSVGDGKTSAEPATSTFPPADFRVGDSPVDHPGASRAQSAPTTIEVVQPERTIVRDVDEALPIVLSGTALLAVLAMLGFTLVRARLVPRPDRSH